MSWLVDAVYHAVRLEAVAWQTTCVTSTRRQQLIAAAHSFVQETLGNQRSDD